MSQSKTVDCGAAGNWNIDQVVSELRAARDAWREAQQRNKDSVGRELPSRQELREVINQLTGALFPMRLGPSNLRQQAEDFYVGHTLDMALTTLFGQIRQELIYANRYAQEPLANVDETARTIVREFAALLPKIRILLDSDIEAAYHGDPAARSVDEILLCYPGVIAMIHHRIAHELYRRGAPLVARIISEMAHSETGIDIHPGAQIGSSFFIDHGTGVVIGETAIIGNNVRLYQAVTLGAKRFTVDEDGHLEKGQPRHPIVEDDVVIYAGATVLGRITIGKGSVIGGNVWLTRSLAPGSSVSQAESSKSPCE